MSLAIRAVQTPAELRAALALPARLHGTDPSWVAPLRLVVRRRTAQFLDHGHLTLLIAERDGAVVGTLSVLRDKKYEEDKGEKVAWFGYFEAVNDEDVVRALFDAAAATAKGFGATHLRGPRDLTRFENVGVTVDGYDTLPPFLQGHHPPHYARLLEAIGFAPHHDVLAYDIPVVSPDGVLQDLPPEVRAKANAVDIPNLEVRAAQRRRMGRDLGLAYDVLDAAFRTVPDIAPMPRSAFMSIGRTYLTFADPQLLQLALVDGRPVGFAACFPELNEAFAAAKGRVLPLGWLRMARGLRRVRTASFKLIGVIPEFRGTGLHARLIAAVVDGVRAAGYHRVEASVVDERNGPMRAVVEGIGMKVYRRYRFYERAIA